MASPGIMTEERERFINMDWHRYLCLYIEENHPEIYNIIPNIENWDQYVMAQEGYDFDDCNFGPEYFGWLYDNGYQELCVEINHQLEHESEYDSEYDSWEEAEDYDDDDTAAYFPPLPADYYDVAPPYDESGKFPPLYDLPKYFV